METIKIEVHICTGFAGAYHTDVIEVDKDSWVAMCAIEHSDFLDGLAREFLFEKCECSATVIS